VEEGTKIFRNVGNCFPDYMKKNQKSETSNHGWSLIRNDKICRAVCKNRQIFMVFRMVLECEFRQNIHLDIFTFIWRCIVLYMFLIKPTEALISKFILVHKSTCFGQLPCPSSGVIHCTFGAGTFYASLTTACE